LWHAAPDDEARRRRYPLTFSEDVMTQVAPRPIIAEPATGAIEICLDWDGHVLDCWTVDEWDPTTIPASFDVGEITYDVVSYTVPKRQPDGRVVGLIRVQPDIPSRPHRVGRRR
jgi:hypothetical protein